MKTIIVCGYGPGISSAVAEKFGAEGFAVALVARSAERLAAGVRALEAKKIRAAAFPTDASDPAAVEAMIGRVREALGPVAVVHWNAYGAAGTGNLLEATAPAMHALIDVAVTSLVAAARAALPDLKEEKGAVLVTNGGFGLFDPTVDAAAVQWNAMGLAVANSAKHKAVGLLAEKLRGDGVYVGEVMVLGTVKGTAFDQGNATLAPSTVAAKFWDLYTRRAEVTANVGA